MRSTLAGLAGCLSLALLLSLTTACGGSSSNESGGGTDASLGDATNGASNIDSGGIDSGNASDASDASDAGQVDAAPVCPGKSAACETCCDTTYPAGSQKFDVITLECACAPSLCGPLDGGAPDSGSTDAGSLDAGSLDAGAEDGGAEDAAVFGLGACAATCSGHTEPNAACNTCIRDSLGSQADPGTCGDSIIANCLTDSTCQPYLACVLQCE